MAQPSFQQLLGGYAEHCDWMRQAIAQAQAAAQADEVPVGAVVVDAQGRCLAQTQNRRERDHDPSAHAEILALRQAGAALGQWRLRDCILYVTLEPCPMCAGALSIARLGALVYGADDPKAGAVRSVLNLPDSQASFHSFPVLGGILEEDCRDLLQQYFLQQRQDQRPQKDKK
jgi:tRNA(adenine34) deaminase